MICLISCGEINKYIIYVLIGGFGKILAEVIYDVDREITKHPFYLGIASGLGMSLSLIPLIIFKIKTKNLIRKSRKPENRIFNEQIEQLINKNIANNDITEKNKKQLMCQKYLLIFVSAFLDFTQKILTYVFIDNIVYNFWTFDMIFLSLFSYFILKIRLYIHQYLTIVLMIISGISINIINLYNVEDISGYKNILLVLLIEIIFSLSMVINKFLMEYNFCSPYEISFAQGFFSLIINVILLAIFTHIEMKNSNYQKIEYMGKKYLDNFYQYLESIDSKKLVVFIVSMISRLLFNLFSIITVKYYTPSHIGLILLIGEITFIFNSEIDWKLFTKIIIIIILAISLFVFTEIIELNFCGLQKYTRKNIKDRADKDNDISDDSNEVDGWEINLNDPSISPNSKIENNQNDNNEKDSSEKLMPDEENEC